MGNSFFLCFLCFLLKSVNHIKMPCGKQFVWIEFTRVHTLTPIAQHDTHHPSADGWNSVNVPTAEVFTQFPTKRKIIQFNFNAISPKKMLQFKHIIVQGSVTMEFSSIYVECIFRFNQITSNYIYYPVIIDNLWTQLTEPCSFKCSTKSSVTDGFVCDTRKLLLWDCL